MGEDLARFGAHPPGEQSPVEPDASGVGVVVDSFAGSVRVEFDHEAAFTPLGQLPFFIDFLKTAGLFEAFVADSPRVTRARTRPRSATCWGRRCCRCWPGTSATRISRRCEATACCPSFST